MADINSEKKRQLRVGRHRRVRAKVSGTAERPRLSVYRSLKHIYAQVINDETGRTLVAVDEREMDAKELAKLAKGDGDRKGKTAVAYVLGKQLAEKAAKAKIKLVVFDRGGFAFKGRVAALAQGARDNGLEF